MNRSSTVTPSGLPAITSKDLYLLQLHYPVWAAAFISAAVFVVWVLCCLGNLLVIVAIAVDRRLKGVQNWFLASLAAADFLLGVLVLPFSLVKQLVSGWVFGPRWCELWLVIDVLLCTASILNLCLISLDRYWSVSRPLTYPHSRTPRRATGMIALVWLLAAIICVPPLLGWRKPQPNSHSCQLTDDLGYVLYSTIGSFYIPTTIMSVVYAKIFFAARDRVRRNASRNNTVSMPKSSVSEPSAKMKAAAELEETAAQENEQDLQECGVDRLGDCELKPCLSQAINTEMVAVSSSGDGLMEPDRDSSSSERVRNGGAQTHGNNKHQHHHHDTATGAVSSCSAVESHLRQKRKLAKHRERRATMILGLIMGAFIFCWFPFFTTYVVEILCKRARCAPNPPSDKCSCIPMLLFDFFFWLGYCNSALNPVIYTVFNRDFRLAFQKLLTCGRRLNR